MKSYHQIIAVVVALFAFAPTLSAQNTPDDEEDVYFILSGEADKAISDGDYDTAVLRIREAINVDPSNPSNVLLLSNLGILYNQLDQDSLALKAFDDAISIAPSMTVVINNRAKLLLKMGDKARAFGDFSTVIQRDSCNLEARYYRGLMSLYGGDRIGAEKDFDVLLSEDPESLSTAVALGTLYSMTARDRQAIPYYKKLVEAEPMPEFYAALAGCYLAVSDLSEASSLLSKAISEYPDDPELYYYRAWLNRDRYQLREAREDARKAVSLGLEPSKAEALFAK